MGPAHNACENINKHCSGSGWWMSWFQGCQFSVLMSMLMDILKSDVKVYREGYCRGRTMPAASCSFRPASAPAAALLSGALRSGWGTLKLMMSRPAGNCGCTRQQTVSVLMLCSPT